jgi:YHS domain-containing protein
MKSLMLSFGMTLLLALGACAQKGNKAEIFSNKAGAIKGYDPVAYFSNHQPVKGKEEVTYVWKNATWHFANEENKATFEKNPEQYAPQYGGYCAYGLAKGYKVKIEPEAWAIENGKLYLNYDKGVQKDWDKDRKGYIEKANENWVEK